MLNVAFTMKGSGININQIISFSVNFPEFFLGTNVITKVFPQRYNTKCSVYVIPCNMHFLFKNSTMKSFSMMITIETLKKIR